MSGLPIDSDHHTRRSSAVEVFSIIPLISTHLQNRGCLEYEREPILKET